ncbi:RNA-directed DNA polymerase [Pseudonocardia alaniniphila]|uniref:RNA-directed DNA polymerase n=1 Tax=Pseudonocardia alaniniphila TaxID=75291 RepID=A0ABS9TMS1_9PSEU|nr:RNA-directed DNA polymerase [Pseudonocardia alaniniphila]MCH6169839.1 RNA-directed DNA polymerase [Pseudonocardia alaniniphila]
MLALSSRLLDELNLAEAAKAEAEWTPDLVPSQLVNAYAAANVEAVVDYVSEKGRTSLETAPADVIAASKWQYGRRPVAFLPLTERVLYRAVVATLADDLPFVPRGKEAYRSFQRRALIAQGATHVVTTDLANFYSSIPTDRLVSELVDRTGRWEPVEWLRDFWLHAADGSNGLPQVSQPSDLVAESYADELHRRLLRRNVRAWRWADDFRFAATSANDAYAALEIFDEEARKLGLTVNERKTRTQTIAEYGKSLDAGAERLQKITKEVAADLTDFNPYDDSIITPSEAQVQEGAAEAILEYWRKEKSTGQGRLDLLAQMELASLLRHSLSILEVLARPSAIEHCADILQSDPQLTPQVVRYLAALSEAEQGGVRSAARYIIENIPLNRWQRLWFLDLYSQANLAPVYDREVAIPWIESNLTDTSEVLRSSAVWALSMNWTLTQDQWNLVTGSATSLGTPWLSAGLLNSSGPIDQRDTLLSSDKLARGVYNWTKTWDPFPPPF